MYTLPWGEHALKSMGAAEQPGPLRFISEGGAAGKEFVLSRKPQSSWRGLAGPSCITAPLPVLTEGLPLGPEKLQSELGVNFS